MEFTLLHRFRSRLEAEMAAEVLSRAEIPYLIQSEDIGIFGPGASPTPAGARLLVHLEDLNDARTLLLGMIEPG